MKMARKKYDAERMKTCTRLMAIGQLSAGIAHELNNPLSVILGYVQSLVHQCVADKSILPALKTIERETLRCKRLVQDLLNISRSHKPLKVFENIEVVLEGALSLVEARTRIQRVVLKREFATNLPVVSLSPYRIQQMLINLCINAMDAMPEGGQLTIRVAIAKSSKNRDGLTIEVTDTGTGISRDVQKHMFEPFFTTKEAGKGTGLGLSLVQDIVQEHSGQIKVKSSLGVGSTFTIWLPLNTLMIDDAAKSKNNPSLEKSSH